MVHDPAIDDRIKQIDILHFRLRTLHLKHPVLVLLRRVLDTASVIIEKLGCAKKMWDWGWGKGGRKSVGGQSGKLEAFGYFPMRGGRGQPTLLLGER